MNFILGCAMPVFMILCKRSENKILQENPTFNVYFNRSLMKVFTTLEQ
jgi:hypothetical protein